MVQGHTAEQYSRLKIKTQTIDGRRIEYTFEPDASGPFGDDLPGSWLTYNEAMKQYKSIFHRYRLFGDHSSLNKMPQLVQGVTRKLYRIGSGENGPLPGWFDTHASL